jgi:hypothetical protein
MKRTPVRLFSAVFLLAFPAAAWAVQSSVDSTTILRIEQRDTGTQKDSILPATQFLGLDADKLADGNLSLHFYGWGRADLGERSFNDDSVNGSLSYAFLQYRFKQANADLRAGRIFVHDGIANEHLDGLSLRSDLPLGFAVSAFGGATVHTAHIFGESSDGKGDGLFGGRLSYRYRGALELGLSGVYEGKAPALAQHTNGNHRLVSGDLWFSPHKSVDLAGHTSYNTETSHLAEHSYLLNLRPLPRLVVSGEFNQQNDRSYQYAWAMFSGTALNPTANGALLNPSNLSRSLGSTVSYQVNKALEVAADYKHYRREVGVAERFGANAKFSFLDNAARAGASYHYLQAGSGFAITPNASGSYHELRGYAMHDGKSYFAALDFIDYLFKDRVFGERSAWEGIASLGYHITPDLALSGDLSYGRNPEFTEETRGLLRLTYNMTTNGAGGKK